MRPFLLEPIFWQSATHVVLRSLGLSHKSAFRVMVRVEPVWLQKEQMGKCEAFGVYATQVVMAHADAAARAAAVERVREAILAVAGPAGEAPPAFEVEESNALRGVAWHQPRGFSLYPVQQGPQPRHE
jgi:hypothetical protein